MGSTSHAQQNSYAQSNGNGFASGGGGFLKEMLENKLLFGEPTQRASFAPTTGLREVFPGPPSPPRSLLRLEPLKEVKEVDERHEEEKGEMGGTKDLEVKKRVQLGPMTPPHLRRKPSRSRSLSGSPTPSSRPITKTTNTIKTAEPPSPSPNKKKKLVNGTSSVPQPPRPSLATSSSSTPSLHPPITDHELLFPKLSENNKRQAAGLYNPSMACYANATLQVMMHTPPFVRELVAHESKDCEFTFSCIALISAAGIMETDIYL